MIRGQEARRRNQPDPLGSPALNHSNRGSDGDPDRAPADRLHDDSGPDSIDARRAQGFAHRHGSRWQTFASPPSKLSCPLPFTQKRRMRELRSATTGRRPVVTWFFIKHIFHPRCYGRVHSPAQHHRNNWFRDQLFQCRCNGQPASRQKQRLGHGMLDMRPRLRTVERHGLWHAECRREPSDCSRCVHAHRAKTSATIIDTERCLHR